MRAITCALVVVATAGVGAAWTWRPGFVLASAAALIGVHALRRRRRPGSLVSSLLLDITVVNLGLAVSGPPTEVAVAPVVVMVTTAALFLGDRRALWLGVYATLGATAAFTWARLADPVSWSTAEALVLIVLSAGCFLPLMGWLLKEAGNALTQRRLLEQALRERESRYRHIAEGVSDAIVTTDESGVLMYANPAVERIFGYGPDELVGKHMVILMPDRVHDSLGRGSKGYIEVIRQSLEMGGVELNGRHRDGRELTLEVSFGQFVGLDGRRYIGTIRDITERKESQEALRESEARYRGLFEGVPVGVYRTSISGEILDANKTLVELLGYERADELIGRQAQEFYTDPSERDVWRHNVESSDVARAHEIQLHPVGRSPIWVRDSGRQLRAPSGELIGYEGTLEDVTERRQAEERLQAMIESQRHRLLYEKALSACSHALLVGTDDSALEDALQALLDATGVSSVFIERNAHDPELGLVTNLIYELNSERQPPDYERWSRLPWSKMPVAHSYLSRNQSFAFSIGELEGEERRIYEESNTKAELDIPIFVGSEWLGLVGFTDFEMERPWRDEEASLLRTAAQMIGAFWERQQAHRRLQELVDYKDEFVASVSHELRTPLTAVVGLSEELVNQGPESFSPKDLAEFHQLIAQQSREVAYIVDDLLVAARVENNAVTVDLRPVDLDEEVTATITGWPSEFGAVQHDAGGAKVEGDAARIRQVVRNLLTNAIRYGGEEVVVVTSSAGDMGILQVRDNGIGVGAEDLERIFQPYERATSPDGVKPGSVGLGLYVSRHLVRLMGGELTCRREDDMTVFELALPLL